jgi:hypothetical protein
MPQPSEKGIRLRVKASLLDFRQDDTAKAAAYVFSSGGQLIAHEALDANFSATLALPAAQEARSLRILVGPQVEEKEVRLTELIRRGAEERHFRLDPGIPTPSVDIAVIPSKWHCWLLGLCFVRGTLLKRVILGGTPTDLPVCGATVEIFEVDPLLVIIPRLPDLVIERIRDFILRPVFPPRPDGPFPPPPPGPFLRPVPGRGPEGFDEGLMAFSARGVAEGEALQVSRAAQMAQAGPAVSELRYLAQSTDTFQFRQALLNHAVLVQPLLCLFHPAVTTKLLTTATTDDCGRFHALFFRGCNNPDTPDLYFKAKQKVFPFFPPITIYAPTPVACFTRWNYQCGSEVTLYTTHPLARTCLPCPPVIAPNNWVLVMAIGNRPVSLIRGASVPLQSTTNATNLGLTLTQAQAEAPSPADGAPFGELLRLRLEFDNSLRQSLGVKYYRVSYRKGASGAFTQLEGTINRHYTVEVGTDLVLKVFPVGPQVVGTTPNLFEIPPALPPEGQWTLPNVVEDTTSAKFNTLDLAALAQPGLAWPQHGKYQLKVDLFDTAGNLVNIDAPATQINYRVPSVTDLSGDIDTDDANALGLVVDDDGDGKKSFIMTLHVDNSRCKAGIAAPKIGTVEASPNCGVLEYDPNSPGSVTMDFSPTFPTGIAPIGFASYSFEVTRGATDLTLPPAPQVPTIPASGAVPIPPAPQSNVQTVLDLLGGCVVAGFAEHLEVSATATNGWRRLWEYDAEEIRAFVLSPIPQEEP